jgi:hypothetical protein
MFIIFRRGCKPIYPWPQHYVNTYNDFTYNDLTCNELFYNEFAHNDPIMTLLIMTILMTFNKDDIIYN